MNINLTKTSLKWIWRMPSVCTTP